MRCKHGKYIHYSWDECYECVREKDEDDANYAAIEAAEEAKKQTEILKRIESTTKEKSAREKELEAIITKLQLEIGKLRAEIAQLKGNK